jgi:hypothetical protein
MLRSQRDGAGTWASTLALPLLFFVADGITRYNFGTTEREKMRFTDP